MYCYFELLGPFLQSAFCQCYFGFESNGLCLENSLKGQVSHHVHLCIIVDVLSLCLDFVLHYLTSGQHVRLVAKRETFFLFIWAKRFLVDENYL